MWSGAGMITPGVEVQTVVCRCTEEARAALLHPAIFSQIQTSNCRIGGWSNRGKNRSDAIQERGMRVEDGKGVYGEGWSVTGGPGAGLGGGGQRRTTKQRHDE